MRKRMRLREARETRMMMKAMVDVGVRGVRVWGVEVGRGDGG